MAKGRRLEPELTPDPWASLAVAILERAIDDAKGRKLYKNTPGAKEKTIADARYWLRTGAGGLPSALGIDDQALGDALGL